MATASPRRLEVRLGTFRSTVAGLGDGEGASMLAAALRQRGFATLAEGANCGEPTRPAGGGKAVIVVDGRIGGTGGLGAQGARAAPGRVVVDLTAKAAGTDAVIDAQTASRPCVGSPTEEDEFRAIHDAARSAIAEAVSQLLDRLLAERTAQRRASRRGGRG